MKGHTSWGNLMWGNQNVQAKDYIVKYEETYYS